MKTVFYFITGLFLCCVLVFCNVNKDPLNSKNVQGFRGNYLGFTDNHCQDAGDNLAKTVSRIYLKEYWFNQDIMTLCIHYSANCCPGFVDSVSVKGNVIDIVLADTLRMCHCVCDYDNDFSFLYYDEGELRIIFKWWDIPKNQFTTEMDTTIIVTR